MQVGDVAKWIPQNESAGCDTVNATEPSGVYLDKSSGELVSTFVFRQPGVHILCYQFTVRREPPTSARTPNSSACCAAFTLVAP